MKNCKNCGASAPPVSSQHSYVCEYCHTKNVDDDYFKELARTSDLGKSDRHAQLGINAYVSDQFDAAEKHFEASVLEHDKNAQVWIYLALCKSSLLTASNFDKNIKAIDDSISRAHSIDGDSDVVTSGKIAIFDRLTSRVASIADSFFETAHKTYVALGENKDGASSAVSDLVRGAQRIATLSHYHVTDSQDYAGLVIDGLGQLILYEQKGATSTALDQAKKLLESELLGVFDKNPDLIIRTLDQRGGTGKFVKKLLSAQRSGSIAPPQEDKQSKGFLSKFFS